MNEMWMFGVIIRDFDLVGLGQSLGVCTLTNIPGVPDVSSLG